MSQQPPEPPQQPNPELDDTGERQYTPEELERYAAEQARSAAAAADPLNDPIPGFGPPPPPPAPPAPAGRRMAAPENTVDTPARGITPIQPMPGSPPPAGPPPANPPPAGPPPAGPPVSPPMAGAPPPPPASAPPASAPPASAPPASAEQGDQTMDRTSIVPAVPAAASVPPAPETSSTSTEPRRFMTATDFLDRRDNDIEYGPATWGWRGRMRRWSGGLIKPEMGPAESEHESLRRQIQKDFDGPRTIVFINPKGGAAKTTGVLAAGHTFGTVRGGGVVAWDNNETRGTLGMRGMRSTHRNTTRELLEDLGRFKDVYQSRIGDLGAFVRSQGDAHFDVLASDERPDVTGTIRAEDFGEVHRLLERFYRVILIDTGNNLRAENWLAAAETADLLVVTSTVREDTGYSGLWMLDALQDAGYGDLKHKCVTVLSDPSPQVDSKLADDLTQVYEQRTRGVYRIPYDPVLVSGSVVPYASLSEATRTSWLKACAAMAAAL